MFWLFIYQAALSIRELPIRELPEAKRDKKWYHSEIAQDVEFSEIL